MIRLFAFDVHGVFITRILDDPEILGGQKLVDELKRRGYNVAVIASGSNWSTKEYAARLRSLGFNFDDDEVWPASRVAALHLSRLFGKARCLVLGEPGLVDELTGWGHEVVDDWRIAEAVVVGLDRQLTYKKLTDAIRAVHKGAYFLAVNKVRWYYMPGEGPIASPGAIVAAIEYQTRREAVVVGKPSVVHYYTVLSHFGIKPEEAVMVGDDVEADLIPAKTVGMKTVLVSSVDRTDKQEAPPKAVDIAISHVDELLKYVDNGQLYIMSEKVK